MRVELHSHTHHSKQKKVYYDGVCTPEQMVKAASRKGLGALGVTDHDSLEGVKDAKKYGKKYGVLIIPGEEVTTWDGHCLALGVQERITPGMTLEDTLDKIKQQGGVSVAVHPFDIKKDGMREKCRKCDAIEVFNALNMDRISNNRAWNFALKTKKPMVAGSDAHNTEMIGHGNVMIEADSVDDILKAIKKGKTRLVTKYPSIMTIMRFSVQRLNKSYDYTNNYIEKNYKFPKRQLSAKMLRIAGRSPGTIDYLFKGFTYTSFSLLLTYSALKHAVGKH